MEMFGLTLTGYDNYIRELMKEGYKEPRNLPNLKEMLEGRLRLDPSKTFDEIHNEIDPILGLGDGFSYGSYERLYLQRRKGLVKLVGPTDMYRIPATRGQDFGYWTKDPILQGADWPKLYKNYRRRSALFD